MASSLVVLAHEPSAARHAQRIAADLTALGYKVGESVGPTVRHKQAAKLNAAHRVVVVLWTRAAWRAPALRAAVQRAKAKGKLVCVALDAAPPPAAGQAVRLSPRGRLAWRRLLSRGGATAQVKAPMARLTMQPRPKRAPRAVQKTIAAPPAAARKPAMRAAGAPVLAALTALALVVLAAGAEAYARDTVFAAKLNGIAQTAQARASELIQTIAPGG